jgi:hypothetical protein
MNIEFLKYLESLWHESLKYQLAINTFVWEDQTVTLPDFHEVTLMDGLEKVALHVFCQGLPADARVLEMGTFMGGSSAIMANANRNITIDSIDAYVDQHDRDNPAINSMLEKYLGKGNPRTIDRVQDLLLQYTNIKLHQGYSPRDFETWDSEIDVYFEDGLHHDPYLTNNIKFWLPKLKSNGYLVLHDYRPFLPESHRGRFKDLERIVDSLLVADYEQVAKISSLLILRKK